MERYDYVLFNISTDLNVDMSIRQGLAEMILNVRVGLEALDETLWNAPYWSGKKKKKKHNISDMWKNSLMHSKAFSRQ